MMQSETLILGASGKTGRRLVALFEEQGLRVHRGTRQPSHVDDVFFDWSNAQASQSAFAGIRRVYIVAPTDRSDHAEVMLPILEAALARGVERMVLLSASSLERGGPMMGKIHEWIALNTPEWAVLRPSWFMQNFSEGRHLTSVRQENRIFSATGQGRLGFIDVNDISAVAKAALTDQVAWNEDVILTGPQTLSYDDIAAGITETVGRKVSHVALSQEALEEKLLQMGLDSHYARLLSAMDVALSHGSETLTDEVLKRTGRPARSFVECLISDPAFQVLR